MPRPDTSQPFPDLAALGPRIAVLGPSNAGKSTLALALSERLRVPAVHLDQLHHLPHTDWTPRPSEEFAALHDAAIAGETWIIEGNYSALLGSRLEGATGAILLDANVYLRLMRYVRRTLFAAHARAGQLEGAQDSLKWGMVDWILFKTRNSSDRMAGRLRGWDKPFVYCRTRKELARLYEAWDVPVPQ